MEPEFNIQSPTSKIYSDNAIRVATFIGGPLVAGYLIAENFNAFNEPDKAKKTWIYTIAATILIFGVAFLIPDSVKIPRAVFPLLYTWATYYLVRHFQGSYISSHLSTGGQVYNWGRTITVSLIGLAVTFIAIVGILYITDANPEKVRTYGGANNEIHFDNRDISELESDELAEAFVANNFFGAENKKFVYVKKIRSNYEISISCDKEIVNNPGTTATLAQLRVDMQKKFPKNKIIFKMVADSLDNVVKRFE